MADPPPPDPNVGTTLGALLVGGSVALMLSGILTVQCIVFYKLYPHDIWRCKATVLLVWFLDLLHSAFIVASLFNYFIDHFGDKSRIDHIPWSVALTVVVTAIQTLIVHWYYAHKIWTSSGKNWWITAPIGLLAFARLLAASVSTSEMIIHPHYSIFIQHFPGWVFTTGLTLSASVDVLITGWLCYYLQSMRRRTSSTLIARLVHTMTLYTLENGLVTCVATTASLISWLTMPKNLIFLGLHFVIGKLYANSLLISLNTRKELREMRWVGPKDSNGGNASMWPIVGHHSTSGNGSGGGGVTSAGGYGASTAFTYPYGVVSSGSMYGVGAEVNMATPTSAYRPAFKVPVPVSPARTQPHESGIRVTRTVRRASDDLSLSDVSRDEYTYTAHVGVAGRRNQFGGNASANKSRRSRERERGRDHLAGALP
ncbi:hypothetical protein C8F01DRAFT_551495 [Mycena amicta]|nr:hypothetical protein C8F01DRAFT_551495 [Mycena amicta]